MESKWSIVVNAAWFPLLEWFYFVLSDNRTYQFQAEDDRDFEEYVSTDFYRFLFECISPIRMC